MLRITVRGDEFFDETTQEFVTQGDVDLELEHSLVSLSKWESKYEKAFLGKERKTSEEVLDYISMMILTEDAPKDIVSRMTDKNVQDIQKYLESKQTATTFNERASRSSTGETITAELLYFWMINHNVPIQCEHWHINKLTTLIRVCQVKTSKPKKMSKSELAARNRELNAQRRAELGTKG